MRRRETALETVLRIAKEQSVFDAVTNTARQMERELAERNGLPAGYSVVDGEENTAPLRLARLAVDAARVGRPPIRSYSTGIPQLDALTGGGLNTRELCVVLGPPGGCKTAFAVSTSLHIERVLPVLYASTELETAELKDRLAANRLRRSWAGLRRGTTDQATVVESLDGVNIYLLGCDVLPRDGVDAIERIETEAQWIAERRNQAPLIVVDYLQDLARGADRDVRTRVGDIAAELRALSQRLDAPLMAVSSVSRTFYSPRKAAEFRDAEDPVVYLAAAKESGDVDYAAARVLFLDAEDDRDKPERAVRIAVAKSRDGRTGFAGSRVVAESGIFVAAPDVLEAMASCGRGVAESSGVAGEDDDFMFTRVVREYAEGRGPLCTRTYLRTGNRLAGRPLGKERAEAALDRLVEGKKLRLAAVQRTEGGKTKLRDVYEPVQSVGGPG